MSKKLWHPTSGALLAGCLMATAAHAQTAPITPTTEPAAPIAATADAPVPQQVAPLTKAFSTVGLEMEFNDITVKELLKTLGRNFGINISVDDSVDGVISYINLTNSTPVDALKTVVETRRDLSFRQVNGVYIVAKAQPGEMLQGTGALQPQPISPTGGIGSSPFDLPGVTDGRNNTAPFTAPPFGTQGFISQGALPPIGQLPMGNNPLLNGLDLPILQSANPKTGRQRQRVFKIKNVPSSFVAYQLDPANNPLPTMLREAQNNSRSYGKGLNATEALGEGVGQNSGFNTFNQNDFARNRANPYLQNSASSLVRPEVRVNSQFGGQNTRGGGGLGNNNGGGGGGGGSFTLPDGIEQITSVDPQNVLLIAYEEGNETGLRELEDLINVLDQPLRQVEIEAQFVELQSQDARNFGIDFSTARGNFDTATTGFASGPVPGSIAVGFVRNNFTARLNALIADNKAKIITAPRVTAINNLTATLTSTESRSLILTSVAQNIGGGQQQAQRLLFIESTTGLTVTPTINGDDTITVLMEPQVTTQDQGALGTRTRRQLRTVANVRDGDTIALGGLKIVRNTDQNFKVPLLGDIPIIGRLFRSKTVSESESELIIFLTARIIRRAGDDVNLIVPGT